MTDNVVVCVLNDTNINCNENIQGRTAIDHALVPFTPTHAVPTDDTAPKTAQNQWRQPLPWDKRRLR